MQAVRLTKRRQNLIAAALLLALASGCTGVLSRDTLGQVSEHVSPQAVLADPEHHIGQVILVAGPILRTENRREGTLIEMLAYPTTARGMPDTSDPAIGRFQLLYPGYLDSLIYQQGRQIVAAGRVLGQRAETEGEAVHSHPLLHPLELKLLPEYPGYSSGIRFGIGVGFGF
jgi:outer membrane lipoprotein